MKSLSSNTIYIKEKMTTKRFLLTLLIASICTFCFGQKVILLTKQNGVYTIPCSINGVKRSLVFDTGASSVTISMQLAELLYRQGKLSDTDIKGYGRSQTASGHIVDNMAIVLKDVEISGLQLKNVDAVVIEGQNVPLLLGLSAIQKLGKVTLQGNRLIIDSSILPNSQLAGIRSQIESHIENGEYGSAIASLKRIESQDAMEERDVFNLAQCYCYSKEYNKALMYCQQWMGTYKEITPSHEPDVCYFMGLSYMGLKSHYDADTWFAKAIRLISIDAVERTSREDANTLSYYYNQKAVNYLEGNAYENSVEAFDIATQYRMRYIGVTAEDLCAGRIKDERIGIWLYSISKMQAVYLHNDAKSERYAILAALCGNKEAIEFCEHFHFDYSPKR